MNMSLLGVLLVGALGVITTVSAGLACATVARDARCRRRRSQLRLVVGAGGTASERPRSARRTNLRPASDGTAQTSRRDPRPVPQWQPPLERAHRPGASPAA